MSISQVERTRLSLAAVISMTLCSTQLLAQDIRRSEVEEVIVTGSLIEGTPEDSALPVEVITLDDLDNLGRPSAMDLVKTMSEIGQVAGEADRSNTFPIGAATVNLRSLGSRYTTVIFNGRRFPEQYSVTTGRFNNISWIPQAAIGRIETLKQGGAVTYGADAMGGVVNYITRRDFDGLELNADYRYIEDSDGDYTADVLWGSKFERGNVLVVAGYQHRSNLMASDRSFTRRHFLENNEPWASWGSPGSYQFLTSLGIPVTPASYTGDRHMSAGGSLRDPYCTELGGFAGWSTTPSPACYFNESNYLKLVEESDTYQFYGELNFKLTDSVELHTELTYNQMDLPDIAMSPSSIPLSWPMSGTGRQNVFQSPVYFVPGSHPAVAPLIDALIDSDGTPTFTTAQRTGILNGRVSLPFGLWRPFGASGHPINGKYDIQENNTEMYRATVELKGDLPEFLGTRLGWSVAGTYSRVNYVVKAQDMLVDRLQAALNGLGGPNCTGTTPGANGCQWFNPFSSAIPRNIYTGQVNPGYIPELANDPALVDWMYVPIQLDREYRMVVADVLLSGDTGLSLPGGPVAIALGGQFRRTDEEFTLDPLSNQALNPCATVGVTTCDFRTGPLVMTRNTTILGTTQNLDRYYPVAAVFGEVALPITSSLTAQIAGRYEKFYSDLTDVDNSVFVPAGAIKWQPLDELAVRFSVGKTFSQVNPPADDGRTEGTSTTNTAFGGFGDSSSLYRTYNYDNVGIESEESTYYNLGFITQLGNFSASIDLWQNDMEKGVRTLTTDGILRVLTNGVTERSAPINCDSPLFAPNPGLGGNPVVVLAGGAACTPGMTLDNLIGGEIHYFGGVGQVNGGEITQRGIDFNASYRFDLFGGSLVPSVDLSYFLKYDVEDFKMFGVTIAEGYDAIGQTNTGAGRLLQTVPEWRGSFGLNYNRGKHTLNLLARYLPSVKNDDLEIFDAGSETNANIGSATGHTTGPNGVCPASGTLTSDLGNVPEGAGTGEFGGPGTVRGFCAGQNTSIQSFRELKASYNIDLTYRIQLPMDMQMSLSIYNLTDEEPEFARSQLSYSAYFGSPLQRNYRLSFRKRF